MEKNEKGIWIRILISFIISSVLMAYALWHVSAHDMIEDGKVWCGNLSLILTGVLVYWTHKKTKGSFKNNKWRVFLLVVEGISALALAGLFLYFIPWIAYYIEALLFFIFFVLLFLFFFYSFSKF